MSAVKSSKKLIALYESLDKDRQHSLSDFADFLLAKSGPVLKEVPQPDDILRPETETVVGAVKRLKLKYHMVESMSVFSAASALMTDHMVKGRDVVEVIDEMETLFFDEYNKMLDKMNKAETTEASGD